MTIRRRTGFTLIDLMIVIVILGVLAAIVLPLVGHHVDEAALIAAESNLSAVEKSIDLYWMQNNSYPATLDDLTFQTNETLILPDGYSFTYDQLTGSVALVKP